MLRLLLLAVLVVSSFARSAAAQTPTAPIDPYVAGNAFDILPAGTPGQVSIIPLAPYEYGRLPILVRNDSDRTLTNLHVLATIRDREGDLIAAEDDWTTPSVVQPGGIAFYSVFFGADLTGAPQANATYTFEYYEAEPAYDAELSLTVPLILLSADISEDVIVGRARNTSADTIDHWAVDTHVLCFSADRQVVMWLYPRLGPTSTSSVAPGAEFPYWLRLGASCARYLVTMEVLSIQPAVDGTPVDIPDGGHS